MLYLCVMKNMTQKKIGKQPCSTFTVSYHVKCEEEEEDESEKQGERRVDGVFLIHRSFPDSDRGLGSQKPLNPASLHPFLPPPLMPVTATLSLPSPPD